MALAASRLAVSFLVVCTLAPLTALASAGPSPFEELAPEFQRWMEEVGPLLSAEERDAFLGLRADYQRRAFIEAFWRARDPFPETAVNELRERWEERAREARQRFDRLDDHRVAVFLVHGEPATIFPGRCGLILRPVEVWLYPGGATVVFIRQGDVFELWDSWEGLGRLLVARGTNDDRTLLEEISRECVDGERLATALARALSRRQLEEAIRDLPRPGSEWLHGYLTTTTDLPSEAATFAASLELSFPGSRGGRTVVQGLVEVPRGEDTIATEEGAAHDYVVDGEVLRKGELFENFRYRFRLPAQAGTGDTLPLIFQRHLRPGPYRLLVRVQEVASGRWFREERDVEVPITLPPADGGAQLVAAAAPPEPVAGPDVPVRDPAAEANRSLARADNTIRLLPPPEGLRVGNTRIEAVASGPDIARVRFLLDGETVLSKARPPYSVEIGLGEDLRAHEVSAVAVDSRGDELARDEIVVNAGPHRFAVRLVEPHAGQRYERSARAQAEVHVPEGDTLERVEIFLDDALLATLYQPPFAQPVLLPPGGATHFVRAVAHLADGNAAEDVVVVNAPENFEEVDVHLVELYTSVLDRMGRPLPDLAQEDFQVLEEGVEQEVRRFERVDDVSIYAGILLDTSSSMSEELPAALAAADRFFETVLRPRDRAAVITFSNDARLAVRFTNNPEVLAGGLAGVSASGGTALWDSLVYSLYYFSGVRGKRALILLSDGDDQGSSYSFDEALDYARRTGVSVYAVGLGAAAHEPIVRTKLLRLTGETGGACFFIARSQQLDGVYRDIEKELRSQYLIAYQSSLDAGGGPKGEFRRVEVRVGRPGAEAKTIRGYYP
jgi:VWFA-related protein